MPTIEPRVDEVRKVCDRMVGRPRRSRSNSSPLSAAWRSETSTGTIGLTQSTRSAPASSATEACIVLSSTPSTKRRPSISTGG
jgi:hypothetical protein